MTYSRSHTLGPQVGGLFWLLEYATKWVREWFQKKHSQPLHEQIKTISKEFFIQTQPAPRMELKWNLANIYEVDGFKCNI